VGHHLEQLHPRPPQGVSRSSFPYTKHDTSTLSTHPANPRPKSSLTGHSDSNGDEDTGHLHVTYANNYWSNIASRAPSVRFGTVHIFNQYYDTITSSGVNTREGAEVLVESSTFVDAEKPITAAYSDVTGYANVNDVDLGSGENDAPEGTLTSVDYEYTLLGSASVKAAVVGTAGNTLTLG
jgi:pectate lyase